MMWFIVSNGFPPISIINLLRRFQSSCGYATTNNRRLEPFYLIFNGKDSSIIDVLTAQNHLEHLLWVENRKVFFLEFPPQNIIIIVVFEWPIFVWFSANKKKKSRLKMKKLVKFDRKKI